MTTQKVAAEKGPFYFPAQSDSGGLGVISADQKSARLVTHPVLLIILHLHIYDKNVLRFQWLIVYRHVHKDCRNGKLDCVASA